MRQRRNWAPGLGLALGILGFASYIAVIALRVGPATSALRDSALVHLVLIGIGLGLSVVGIRRALAPTSGYRGRWLAPIFGTLNLGLAALFVLFLFPFAALPRLEQLPAVGRAAPDFTLPDETGTPRQLAALRGKNVLLVFYRGHW